MRSKDGGRSPLNELSAQHLYQPASHQQTIDVEHSKQSLLGSQPHRVPSVDRNTLQPNSIGQRKQSAGNTGYFSPREYLQQVPGNFHKDSNMYNTARFNTVQSPTNNSSSSTKQSNRIVTTNDFASPATEIAGKRIGTSPNTF